MRLTCASSPPPSLTEDAAPCIVIASTTIHCEPSTSAPLKLNAISVMLCDMLDNSVDPLLLAIEDIVERSVKLGTVSEDARRKVIAL